MKKVHIDPLSDRVVVMPEEVDENVKKNKKLGIFEKLELTL